MNNDWMYAPGTGFDLASLSLFSPLMPTAYTVPHHTLRLLYAISSQAQIRFGSEEEILLGNRMLLLAQDTPYMAISNNSASMLGQLDIVLRKAEGRLMLPQRLYRFNTDYADLCACSSPVLPFQDSSGLIKCLTSVLQLRIGSLGPSSALVELTLATILMAVGDALYDTDNVSVAHTQHVQHALKFIHDHYMEPIVTEDVAQEVHLHPNYLHRIFATEMGRSIGEYL
ncbi:MAG: AraC family transcriptional regulator, partial [Clostridia bacterium]